MIRDPATPFETVHAPGSKILTCSNWPTLVLVDEYRPSLMPTPLRYSKHLTGELPFPKSKKESRAGAMGKFHEPAVIWGLEHGPLYFDGVMDLFGTEGAKRIQIPLMAQQLQHWHEWINACGHLDGEAEWCGEIVNVEVKSTTKANFQRLWESGPPLHVRLQTQAQMACSGHGMTLIVAGLMDDIYFPDWKVFVFEEPRDEDLISQLEAAAEEFLEVVEQGLPFKHKERWG